jgi:hypothetical protein
VLQAPERHPAPQHTKILLRMKATARSGNENVKISSTGWVGGHQHGKECELEEQLAVVGCGSEGVGCRAATKEWLAPTNKMSAQAEAVKPTRVAPFIECCTHPRP